MGTDSPGGDASLTFTTLPPELGMAWMKRACNALKLGEYIFLMLCLELWSTKNGCHLGRWIRVVMIVAVS